MADVSNKIKKKPTPPSRRSLWSYATPAGTLLITALGLGATLLAYIILRTDVTIDDHVRLVESDPTSTLFLVRNPGPFSISDVRFSCQLNELVIGNYHIALRDQVGVTDPKFEPKIDAGNGQDITCLPGVMGVRIAPAPGSPPAEYAVADISLTVDYKPLLWSRRTKTERFIGRTDDHHRIVAWSHQAH